MTMKTIEITELPILQALGAYTNTGDWYEIIQQLYAQMMGWA
jgi:hypothetical protein